MKYFLTYAAPKFSSLFVLYCRVSSASTWEQRKLGDIAKVTKLAGFEFTKYVRYSEKGTKIALRGLNVRNGKLILHDIKYIDNSDLPKLKRSRLNTGDIVYSYVGTVGESAVIPENDRFYLAPNVALIRVEQDCNSQFIQQLLSNSVFKSSIVFPLISSSSQPALSMDSIRKFRLRLPISSEQDSIGSVLDKIDNLIAANEQDQKQTFKIAMNISSLMLMII
ncbi:restriction endonuclease subunit S [Lactiplantibacillus pentosus]|jgi:type I restriction enzyme S subunit|uniref:restriction endonuclease subunit S n=1 Tax=Lactiplantibacillus pentosus TaxID=1589 RepID=UPI0021A53238|nr:restriction endonuclease subunit S [Lactiplantibacillus pentosus]MCT3285409.1 hypothetical protein [Lactiplantibacillus pentosus]